MRHFQAHQKVKEEAKPVFHPPRPVPFAIKGVIEKELDCLEEEGIVEKVSCSEWAAPLKKMGA